MVFNISRENGRCEEGVAEIHNNDKAHRRMRQTILDVQTLSTFSILQMNMAVLLYFFMNFWKTNLAFYHIPSSKITF